MDTISKISDICEFSENFRKNFPEKRIGFVPTMGYLHEGHLSLVEKVKAKSNLTIVSIFVNPIQFNNPDDLNKYPRDLDRDIDLLEKAGVDILFAPSSREVYPDGPPGIFIDYPGISNQLCGKFRPGHFSGVLTVVHNLFQWTKPHVAAFGRKDYQQLLLIKKMTKDLHMGVEIIEGETFREADGLAMSSRNSRLTPAARLEALKISAALFEADKLLKNQRISKKSPDIYELKNILTRRLEDMDIEYASLYDPETLLEINENGSLPCLAAVAANVGGVRLIDNLLLGK